MLLAVEFRRIKFGTENHVLDNVQAQPPAVSRQIHPVDGAVKARGSVELTTRTFDIRSHLSGRAFGRGFKDHVLKQVADTGLLGGFDMITPERFQVLNLGDGEWRNRLALMLPECVPA